MIAAFISSEDSDLDFIFLIIGLDLNQSNVSVTIPRTPARTNRNPKTRIVISLKLYPPAANSEIPPNIQMFMIGKKSMSYPREWTCRSEHRLTMWIISSVSFGISVTPKTGKFSLRYQLPSFGSDIFLNSILQKICLDIFNMNQDVLSRI